MIKAQTLIKLISLSTEDLGQALARSGYSGQSFESAEFLGMTNGGDFAYKVTYHDEAGTGEDAVGKVFVKYDQASHCMTADF